MHPCVHPFRLELFAPRILPARGAQTFCNANDGPSPCAAQRWTSYRILIFPTTPSSSLSQANCIHSQSFQPSSLLCNDVRSTLLNDKPLSLLPTVSHFTSTTYVKSNPRFTNPPREGDFPRIVCLDSKTVNCTLSPAPTGNPAGTSNAAWLGFWD